MKYDSIRASLQASDTHTERVEVNQRALIDKILARYATPGAVYRELIQNSNDADAKTAEIRFTTSASVDASTVVSQVVYRNNGVAFRPQDWNRLRKIAEGNPDVSKVGAFGVGAYTMFSICEEPLVISGASALAFLWRGDALWTKSAPVPPDNAPWTTFVLPSRDPYPLPNLVEFGQFLCASLTFTQSLAEINVFVNDQLHLSLVKRVVQKPTVIVPPKARSWWSNDGAILQSPQRIFTLEKAQNPITESIVEIVAEYQQQVASVQARYVSAQAAVKVGTEMARKMYRVTKKHVPPFVDIHVFVDATVKGDRAKGRSKAQPIVDAFSPGLGAGRVFIGFKTSQTTGLGAHLAAPLIPTVEREAIDFQDRSLRVYNLELLYIAGIIMRLGLEHSMERLGISWINSKAERDKLEESLKQENQQQQQQPPPETDVQKKIEKQKKASGSIMGFARFMAGGVKVIADVISSTANMLSGEDSLLNPPDPRPLSIEEQQAILLMRSFCPEQSTPSHLVGEIIAEGFMQCMPKLEPPVLTRSGVVRSSEARLPHNGMEAFVQKNVVRSIMYKNAEKYMTVVAPCRKLQPVDLEVFLKDNPLPEDMLVKLMKWWPSYCRSEPASIELGPAIKQVIKFVPSVAGEKRSKTSSTNDDSSTSPNVKELRVYEFYHDRREISDVLPLPASVLPRRIQEQVEQRVLEDKSLSLWFSPIPFRRWADFVCGHSSMTDGRKDDANVRLEILLTLFNHYIQAAQSVRPGFSQWLAKRLANVKCIPVQSFSPSVSCTACPPDVYLSSAQIAIFEGLGSFQKVSNEVSASGISDTFLVSIGVRRTISIDFLFTQLDNLKWSNNPKPLISYLQSASLTREDLQKLKSAQYLPEVKDKSKMYAPSELLLPDPDLKTFPFVKILQWPSTERLNENTDEGKFLKHLGCSTSPALETVVDYATQQAGNREVLFRVLDFLATRTNPSNSKAVYERAFMNDSSPLTTPLMKYRDIKVLPVIIKDVLNVEIKKELASANSCFCNSDCLCLGFPVIDPALGSRKIASYEHSFRLQQCPTSDALVQRLLLIVSFAKKTRFGTKDSSSMDNLLSAFNDIFVYLGSRSSEFNARLLSKLRSESFIPARRGDTLNWFKHDSLYFVNEDEESDVPTSLFQTIQFSPFLAAVGVRQEPSLTDIYNLLVSNPRMVLQSLGDEEKYCNLLRRLATNSSIVRHREQARKSPFLLAYKVDVNDSRITPGKSKHGESAKGTYELARASDISIIDNSSFARMFNVLTAPQEPLLEHFYMSLGSLYISKRVDHAYQVVGKSPNETELTTKFRKRIRERLPLLLYPHATSRKLKPDAGAKLEDNNLDVFEAISVRAIYSLGGVDKRNNISCCARKGRSQRIEICLTKKFDWFDVGQAIAGLILERNHLEDAVLIGSLLETSLEQLRARGFPVDRLVKPVQIRPAFEEPPAPEVSSKAGSSSGQHSAGSSSFVAQPIVTGSTKSESNTAKSTQDTSQNAPQGEGFESILRNMFPLCDPEHIRRLLGPRPDVDKLREIADKLADGNYPKKKKDNQAPAPLPPHRNPTRPSPVPAPTVSETKAQSNRAKEKSTKGTLKPPLSIFGKGSQGSNALGRAIRSFRGGGGGGVRVPSTQPPPSKDPVLPEKDRANFENMQQALSASIYNSSSRVSSKGISAPDTVAPIPRELDRGPGGCEVTPGHELKLWSGPSGSGKTSNGIKVFSTTTDPQSEVFLTNNVQMMESFATLLQTLSTVYDLKLSTIAIFHEAARNTIAFNSGGGLYFNIRYFGSLHFRAERHPDQAAYAFWYTVMAHELAHNLVKAHNKDHGFYTESYVANFLPKLMTVLPY